MNASDGMFAAKREWHRKNAALTPREKFKQLLQLQQREVQIAKMKRARGQNVPIPVVWKMMG